MRRRALVKKLDIVIPIFNPAINLVFKRTAIVAGIYFLGASLNVL